MKSKRKYEGTISRNLRVGIVYCNLLTGHRGAENSYLMKLKFQNIGGGHRLLQFAYGAPRRPKYLFDEVEISKHWVWASLITL